MSAASIRRFRLLCAALMLAALVGITLRRPADQEARLHRADLPHLLSMAGIARHLMETHAHWHDHEA